MGNGSLDRLFLEIQTSLVDEVHYYTTVECFQALYVYKFLGSPDNVEICFVNTEFPKGNEKIMLNAKVLLEISECGCILSKEFYKTIAIRNLRLPVYQQDRNTFVAGMCAVCRQLVKQSSKRHLLGFKESCLQAPAETSPWTRFCELDMVKALTELLCKSEKGDVNEIPEQVSRFENHMKQPMRIHNIYKLVREKQLNEKIRNNKSNFTKEDLKIEHRFAEGIAFTIADILLYVFMRIIFEHYLDIEEQFPFVNAWMNEVDDHNPYCFRLLKELRTSTTIIRTLNVRIVKSEGLSLYKSEPKGNKHKKKLFTEQRKIINVFSKLNTNFKPEEFFSSVPNYFHKGNIDWNIIEPAHEKNSGLPEQRLIRKRQQLENMANAIEVLAKPGDTIIDFCSGAGHLGILLAIKLPKCTIILIENKANNVERAKKRAKSLILNNVYFYQCNIDYFIGDFDVGTSLHACGSATDAVLQKCQRSRAKFVCCPCCYGSLSNMDHIQYPLSKRLKNVLDLQDFMHIAHAADQAHELCTSNCPLDISQQGRYCMDIVDTDRKNWCEEAGYEVILTRLKPEECTPKNHLLVGWCDKKKIA